MASLPPKFGPFEPLQRLGAGGMAETFVALRRGPAGFEQRVCIKRILPAFEGDAEFVRAFLGEARTSAALRHNNIVQVLDFGIAEEGSHYLALELVDGLDLRALMQGGALDAELVTLIASELGAALEHAHVPEASRVQVIHRDVSPSNVLISRAGEVKLTDFGIARASDGGARTATGVIKGKVPYMPPEYIEHGCFDARGDLFALGVVLFELLMGERPFDGDSELDTLRRIVAGERKALTAWAPPELIACVERLIATNADERFASARELLDALPPIPVNRVRRRLAELVRARSGGLCPVAPTVLAPLQLRAPTLPTRTRPRLLRPSRASLLALLLSLVVFTSVVVAAALLRFDPHAGASPMPPRPPALPQAARDTRAAAPGSAPEAASAAAAPETARAARVEAAMSEGGRDAREGRKTRAAATAPQQPQAALVAEADAELKVVVVPFGEVWIDDKYLGQSPVSVRLPAGRHTVAVGEGRARERRSIVLTAGERDQIVFRRGHEGTP